VNKIILVACLVLAACGPQTKTSDRLQQEAQELILAEGTSQTGMPAIKNFRERKMLKQIIELRDQDGLVTYTYIVAEMTGKLVFLCNSIGYGMPAATQYTNPSKLVRPYARAQYQAIPQADPNGLFSPASAEGTWVMCADPVDGSKTRPVYTEPRIVVTPFKMAG
jgi:hypothetical protein